LANILFICGGAFDGIDKIIENRLGRKGMGFGAEVLSRKEKDLTTLLSDIQSHDLLKFGIIPELVGRLPVIAPLGQLSRDELILILTEPKNSLSKQYKKLFEYDGVALEFTSDAMEALADEAIKRNIGARGLRAVIEEAMTPIMYDIPSDHMIEKVTISRRTILEKASPEIERNPNKQRRLPQGKVVSKSVPISTQKRVNARNT
jgi:ATP-dependent Clp protease ATP-binding subunit ClpX